MYHKEESGKASKFFEDSGNKKYNNKHDHFKEFSESKKGSHEKGGSSKVMRYDSKINLIKCILSFLH